MPDRRRTYWPRGTNGPRRASRRIDRLRMWLRGASASRGPPFRGTCHDCRRSAPQDAEDDEGRSLCVADRRVRVDLDRRDQPDGLLVSQLPATPRHRRPPVPGLRDASPHRGRAQQGIDAHRGRTHRRPGDGRHSRWRGALLERHVARRRGRRPRRPRHSPLRTSSRWARPPPAPRAGRLRPLSPAAARRSRRSPARP